MKFICAFDLYKNSIATLRWKLSAKRLSEKRSKKSILPALCDFSAKEPIAFTDPKSNPPIAFNLPKINDVLEDFNVEAVEKILLHEIGHLKYPECSFYGLSSLSIETVLDTIGSLVLGYRHALLKKSQSDIKGRHLIQINQFYLSQDAKIKIFSRS